MISHNLMSAPDEMTPMAVAGIEALAAFGRRTADDDTEGLLQLAGYAAVVAQLLPQAPEPATDSAHASPGPTHVAVFSRALERLAKKLMQHDEGGCVWPVDAACDVADLPEACMALSGSPTTP